MGSSLAETATGVLRDGAVFLVVVPAVALVALLIEHHADDPRRAPMQNLHRPLERIEPGLAAEA